MDKLSLENHQHIRGIASATRKLDALRLSGAGQFAQKLLDDRAPNLAALQAWSLLNALMPLVLGLVGLAGLVLTDPSQMDAVEDAVLSFLPAQVQPIVRDVLESIANQAGAVSLISLGLFLWFGSGVFVSMQSNFAVAYHVPERNMVAQQAIALGMLVTIAALVVLSVLAASVPLVSVIGVLAAFQLMYTVLPNRPIRWRAAVPGALVASCAFGLILQLFPLYVALFGGGFSIYLAFGTLMLFLFWLNLVGLVVIIGAELNAFLEAPEQAVYLASQSARAVIGKLE